MEEKNNKISFDDFKKVEIKIGKILSSEKIEGSEKLLKLTVDFKEESGPRQILSGIQKFFPEEAVLVGKKCMFVTNLEPRQMMGLESNGMLFALGGHEDVPFSLIVPETDVPEGTPAN
jgi:methionyl-tRNA synthetase